MENRKSNRTVQIAIIGSVIMAIILIGGTMWMGRRAHQDTADAVRSVSLLYLDELAGRHEQVVEDNLNDNIRMIHIAIGMISDEDLCDLDHMRAYQRNIKRLFSLERFAFVDQDGLVYTADEGIQNDIGDYAFDPQTIEGPEISIKSIKTPDKKVVIAVPIRDEKLFIDGKQLVVCFMEIDMDVMLQGVSMTSQDSGSTFCNIYTADGVALSDTVLGGLAVEDNLLEALSHAQLEAGYSAEGVIRDFAEGRKGTVSFTYNGIEETLSYVPVKGTDWLLTYLIRESIISDRISAVSSGIIWRSLLQSALATLVLGTMFAFIILQTRKNAQLKLEKETSEAENRVKQQEMEQRLALQEQLLEQQAQQDQQAKMITALAVQHADLKGRRVLLAEDVAVNAEIIVMVLGMREVDVDVAENGRIAVEMFAGQPEKFYDAILMDMRMPEMDGLEATRRIRAMDRADAKTIPIIALTANAFDEDVQRSLQAGLNAHLSKPVEPEALYDTLETLIQEA